MDFLTYFTQKINKITSFISKCLVYKCFEKPISSKVEETDFFLKPTENELLEVCVTPVAPPLPPKKKPFKKLRNKRKRRNAINKPKDSGKIEQYGDSIFIVY